MQTSAPCPFEIGNQYGELARKLSEDEFRKLYETHGAILFRGVAKGSEDFLEISSRFGHAWVPYQFGGRDTVSKQSSLQTVNTGKTAIVAHSELSHMPMQPQSAWFYCEIPPSEGGATTLFDGEKIVATMPERLREALSDRRFRYKRRMPIDRALMVYGVEAREQLQAMIDSANWGQWLTIDGDFLYQDYDVPTIPRHASSGRPVFANMLVHNSRLRATYAFFYELFKFNRILEPLFDPFVAVFDRLPEKASRVPHPHGVSLYPTWENERLVPRWIVKGLQQHYLAHEIAVPWQAGDILVIDNTRFMHGRQAVSDDNRRILTRFGFPQWHRPAHVFAEPAQASTAG